MKNLFKAVIVSCVAASFLAACPALALGAGAHAAARGWRAPRTPWGDPDLEGTWPISNLMTVPLQRPKKYGTRLYFTPQEMAQQLKAVQAQNERYRTEETQHRLGMGHWVEDTGLPIQTSLIVDPPDGQLPPETPLGKEMASKMGSDWNHTVFDSVADFDSWDRCITRGLPAGMFTNPYNNGIRIFQAPGYVVITLEMIHESRIVPLGSMPQLDGAIKQWLGSSRGHWEGDTLVVVTTNFNGQTSQTNFPTRGSPRDPRPASTAMRLVERFQRVSADRLIYTVTVDDPLTQTRAWTVRVPWTRDDSYTIYEYACHEGNEAIRDYITASRAQRAKDAAAKSAAPRKTGTAGAVHTATRTQ
jgi:hypothetical protein